MPTIPVQRGKRADQYDNAEQSYLHYWQARRYEHGAEEIALGRLLAGRRFSHVLDVGGGYGRLCVLLERYAERVTLVDPSRKQLSTAQRFLRDHSRIEHKLMQAADLAFPDGSVDLVTMIRVMHHLPDPSAELAEISRVLRPGGHAIIEVANQAHAANRLRYGLHRQRIPRQPVDLRSEVRRRQGGIPFVNHHPATVIDHFGRAGLTVERVLSVSNLRSRRLKKALSPRAMLAIERAVQAPLAPIRFGPSLFFLLGKGPARALMSERVTVELAGRG
jgi:ubiquinone/menaquinone biosynthesis C-methylase UbiE